MEAAQISRAGDTESPEDAVDRKVSARRKLLRSIEKLPEISGRHQNGFDTEGSEGR